MKMGPATSVEAIYGHRSITQPIFFRSWKIVYLSLRAFFGALFTGLPAFKEYLNSIRTSDSVKLRESLLLHKVVQFNKKFYFTPTVPAFPSKAYYNMIKNGGLNFQQAGTSAKRQVESIFLAISGKCNLHCTHCYEKFNINKTGDIPAEKWNNIISAMQKRGVSNFILTGGEPLLSFDKLIQILNNADKELSDFHIHTSGHTLTKEKAFRLKEAGLRAAAVGLDDFIEERNDLIRSKGAFRDAVNSLKLFNEAGIMTYVNFCAGKEMLRNDSLFSYLEFVKSLNVSMIQLLEPRPCGGYLHNSDIQLTPAEKKKLFDFTFISNTSGQYKDYPIVYYVAYIEAKEQLGCHMGGLSLFYIDSAGNVCPCVFMPVTYGNVLVENIEKIFDRMRMHIPYPVRSECPSITLGYKYSELYTTRNKIPVHYKDIQREIDLLYKSCIIPKELSNIERTLK